MSKALEVCEEWVKQKDASYLCVEDKVVWFNYNKLDKSDGSWKAVSLQEAIRMIKYSLLTPTEGKEVTTDLLIQVFQELDVVYELGVESEVELRPEVFNYSKRRPLSKTEIVIKQLVTIISSRYVGVMMTDFDSMFNSIKLELALPTISRQARNIILRKELALVGFDYRDGPFRVYIGGAKRTVIRKFGSKPADISSITSVDKKDIIKAITDGR